MSHKRNSSGNVLIIVLFVIIVMGYLASSLMKVTWSNQSGLTREFLGTKAWFVAQSANDWALTKMYPLNASTTDIVTVCSGEISGAFPPVTKGSGCQVHAMTCTNIGTFNAGTPDAESLFKVQATATCGSGVTQVQRQHEVWVKE
ncbi:MSHA biogenesis protein MshP [Vibrio parahaemolyticus]|uniref:MSHA biogenesis protein MshP n=1 Tax=Vibrio parahaemolyticus TaxID=670 RepID=UPI000A3BEF2C|nr:MSHA biogenesis protein MshP [Vibrio parahaemolyticus]MDF5483093.1 MSHA biogenesis protein MshP [Vibrio parahaemolyticus]MDG2838861.1 MSHA biogenesis protein MshP [Vibrio parahaemolyticus]OUJ60665.1 MSHA biogenesis protein MshP [Vibrio parahaemolyticus]TOA36572.1 MSHA biogenesis protein MshP [Vibrio parahaemolyticus]TOB53966.1 MSHA biogenesis protein MshP [Vibrio parahaemolyticus]